MEQATGRGLEVQCRYLEFGFAQRRYAFNVKGSDLTLMDRTKLNDFATRYTEAWCSQNAADVASFYSPAGSLTINDGAPSISRTEITVAAQSFMTAFPDLVVQMDLLEVGDGNIIYRWTLTGTNTGPGGTGRSVRISGYEEWRFGGDGLIAASSGHFDAADYDRQLKAGATNSR
jgi:hypothetical protein